MEDEIIGSVKKPIKRGEQIEIVIEGGTIKCEGIKFAPHGKQKLINYIFGAEEVGKVKKQPRILLNPKL